MEHIACNLCGEDKTKLFCRGRDRLHHIDGAVYAVVACQSCGLTYVSPRPSEKEIGRYYPEAYGPYQQEMPTFAYGPFSRFVRRFLKKDESKKQQDEGDDTMLRYLDFGSGGGSHLAQVKMKHPRWQLYGLDVVEKACLETKKRGFEVFCGDALSLDLPEDFFDRVHMSHVIEHLHHPQETLKKLYGLMKKGALIDISTPNIDTPSARLFRTYWYALDTPRHLYLFTPETLTKMLENAGFRVKKVDFDRNPKVLLKSIAYVMHRKDLRINPFMWRLFQIIGRIIGERSIMTIEAVKE